MELPKTVKITKIVDENYKTKTFFLDTKTNYLPGQFVMIWLPGIDEKPFALSYAGSETAVSVEKKGEFTKKMFELKKGELLGIRGPYGKGFSIQNNSCVVAGGIGIIPLFPLIKKLKNPTVIYGANTKKDLILLKQLKKYKPILCTDDGSLGVKCFTSELLKNKIKNKKFNVIYACGPEVMIKRIFEIAEKNKIKCEASLERYMKCSIGVCGECAINDMLVCKDGPVFDSEQLRKLRELGKFARLKTGEKVTLEEYYK